MDDDLHHPNQDLDLLGKVNEDDDLNSWEKKTIVAPDLSLIVCIWDAPMEEKVEVTCLWKRR